MTERVLFILAGYSSVGKTTLLVNALKNKIPIFGKKWDHVFQITNLPLRLPEQTMSFQETLNHGTWFSGTHVNALKQLDETPQHIVLHLV
jgi:AAA+ ATPase superfamily predicted ATPase